MIAAIALLLATAFPSASRTAWMRPDAFHLAIGMSRSATMKQLDVDGWKVKPGKDASHVVVDYSDERAMTLGFERERLSSIRFELFELLPKIHGAFAEEKVFLREKYGEPKRSIRSKSIVLYDHTLPNVMVVMTDDPKSENGQKGLGLLVVRYYDPLRRD
jgi:hypothetical protein